MKQIVHHTKKYMKKAVSKFKIETYLSDSAGGADIPDTCDVPGGIFGQKTDMLAGIRQALIDLQLKHKVFIIHHKRVRI